MLLDNIRHSGKHDQTRFENSNPYNMINMLPGGRIQSTPA